MRVISVVAIATLTFIMGFWVGVLFGKEVF